MPRPAATVAILRESADGAGGLDVWLMRRHATMAFAPEMHVFPGGAVDPPDREPAVPIAGAVEPVRRAFAADDDLVRALLSAAVRETFEECGVLYAVPDDPAAPPPEDTAGQQWETRRLALLTGNLAWSALLQGAGLAVDSDALVPWARWVTPEWSPRRYDACFFVAPVPEGQEPRWVPGESDVAAWFGVQDAVERHAAGDLPMMPPTIATLRSLAPFDTVEQVRAAAPGQVVVEAG